MREKPILFNTEMTRMILDGRKTQTRRIIKPQPHIPEDVYDLEDGDVVIWHGAVCRMKSPRGMSRFSGELKAVDICPYTPGDVLWVRETWKSATGDPAGGGYALFDTYIYKADGRSKDDYPVDKLMVEGRWRPSIHMPRKAARIFLKVTGVRVERLQNLTKRDMLDEGVSISLAVMFGKDELKRQFIDLWNGTIKKSDLTLYGWDANPWVWVIEFERIENGGTENG